MVLQINTDVHYLFLFMKKYLLTFKVRIYRENVEYHHGKHVVEGINARDKIFLR